MYRPYLDFIVAGLAAGYITFVFVFSGIGDPVRSLVGSLKLSECVPVQFAGKHISNMLKCPFCTGFWVCVAIQVVFRLDPLQSSPGLLGVALTIPAMSMIAAFSAFVGGKALEQLPQPVGLDNEREES